VAEIILFFGSDDGNTEHIAERIQARLGSDSVEIQDIADATQLDFADADKLILGIPTWDFGQIQSDWEEFWDDLSEVDWHGKTIALYGLGDQFGYGDYFLDAMGMLHDVLIAGGAKMIGYWGTEGYEFDASKAWLEDSNLFMGLAIDQDQQEELTSERLNLWCQQIVAEFDVDVDVTELDD